VTNLTYTYSNPLTGCQNTDITVVTVTPAVIPTVLPTYSICVNNAAVNLNTVLSSTPSGGSWSGTGVTNPNFTPSIAGVGTHTVTYSFGVGTCLTTVTSAITVNPQPIISANNATICVGQSANLTAVGTGDPSLYSWTASPSLSCTACQTTIASPTTTTTYTLTGTTSFGCTNTTTASVSVNPLPVVNAGSDTTLCDQPIPVQFNGTIPGGIWTGSSITTSGLFTPSGTGSYSLTYTVTLPTGCVNSDIKLINVISLVASNAGPDLENCSGDPSVVLSSSPAGGVWSGNGVNSSGIFTPLTAGLFELIYTTGSGNCISKDTMFFNVNPLPIVSAGIDRDFCITDNTFNLSGLPLGGSWSGVGITNAINGTFDPSIAGVGLFQIVYSYTDLVTNCINQDTLIATVHALPVIDFTFNPIVCQGVTEAFTNTSTAVGLSNWNFGDGTLSTNFSPTHTYNSPGLFDVQLIITSPFGCIDSLTQVIEVRDIPFAEFSVAIDSACGPLTTAISNSSTGSGLTYNWQFGNGQNSTALNPTSQVYQAAIGIDTMYYIVLTASNNCGIASYTDSIVVMPLPIASFDTDVNSGCSPLLLNIANLSSGIPDNYSWDFGNGSTSISSANTLQQTFLTGSTITNYTISLNVQNECGSDTFSQIITVYPNTVTAFFNSSTTIGCEDLTVDFTQSTLGGIFYSWDFGDNNTSTNYSPSHTFVDPGTYTVSLFVNDGCAYDTMNVNITVNPAPLLSFSVFPDSVCINETFTFSNTSNNLANSFWTFGDGGTSGLTNPSYAYSQSGQYNVTLVGTSITNGCVDSISQTVQVSQSTVSTFVTSSNSGCAPFAVQFSNQSINSAYHYWVFGDGNTSTQQNPNHLYTIPGTYQVQLITENSSGCSDTSISTITVHAIPVSDFSFISSNTCYVPVEVELTNLSSGALNYSWDFGNGQTSTNTDAIVTYSTPGVYTISLMSENQYGCQALSVQSITVYPTPIAQFDLPSSVACANDMLFFGSESLFADSINWIMGDGTILSGSNVNYAYTDPGDYSITLIAYGAGGCGDTLVLGNPLTINPDPVADFDYINVQIPDPLSGLVEYTNLSEGATSFLWYFGNDSSSTEINPVFHFNDYGSYNTTLIATNNFGCTDSITLIVNVDFFNGLFVPNAIYPGSDLFEVSHFIPKGVGLKEFELLIFDDWGNLIWQSTALDASGRPSEFWDGTFNGEPVQQDAYVWKVNAVFLDNEVWGGNDLNYKKIKKSGTVTVIR
jgi:PKD repeat protein